MAALVGAIVGAFAFRPPPPGYNVVPKPDGSLGIVPR